jgi:hypothetical protein
MNHMDKNLLQKTAEKVIIIDKSKPENEQVTEEQAPSNMLRNVAIGAGALLTGYLLFFSKPVKAQSESKKNVQRTLRADMQLSKNFILSEFLISSEIPELKEYKLSDGEITNLMRLVEILQLISDRFGIPIFINSGGRPATLKAKSGKYKGLDFVQILTEKQYKPSTFSQHMDFSAADFTVSDKTKLLEIYNFVKDKLEKNITQIILYIDNGIPNFIHLGVPSVENDFSKVVKGNNFLLAKVTTEIVDDKKKRKTEFFNYSPEKLEEILSSLPPIA